MPLDPDESPGFLLWHVTLRWQREIGAALAPLLLTHVQFVLLATTWWLNSQGEDPNQLNVARQAGTDVKMASEVLRKLEAKGLIVRTVDASDTRARRLRVTDEGAELAQQRARDALVVPEQRGEHVCRRNLGVSRRLGKANGLREGLLGAYRESIWLHEI